MTPKGFTFVRKYVRATLYVLERFMDNRPAKERKVNVKFWPWIFSTTRFIAVLINNNISQQILRFFMLKKALDL
jgi:hypothetical protein